jgi:hypothetical protein
MPIILATWEAMGGSSQSVAIPKAEMPDPLQKITKAKRSGGVAQVVKHK